jgi:hypothetical protein
MAKNEFLLKQHPHFMDIYFTKIGNGPTIARQVWLTNVEMAIIVAKVAQGKFCSYAALRLIHTPLATAPFCNPVNSLTGNYVSRVLRRG